MPEYLSQSDKRSIRLSAVDLAIKYATSGYAIDGGDVLKTAQHIEFYILTGTLLETVEVT